MTLVFNRDFNPSYGQAVEVSPGVSRLTAPNPGPFTFHGTNTYLIGHDSLAIIDPGPDDDRHFASIMAAIGERPVSHVVVTHSHSDHSPLAARLSRATGAPIYAEGPHRTARPSGVSNVMESGADTGFRPDIMLSEGQLLHGDGWTLRTVLTPGHAANHAVFALEECGVLFSGDHVMGWSTTIVAPPDGSMADYMNSLDRLIERGDRILLPGHGAAIDTPAIYMNSLKAHRIAREQSIMERLRTGDRTTDEIVKAIYKDLDPAMFPAAALSVLAHLDHLIDRKMVTSDGPLSVGGIFRPV